MIRGAFSNFQRLHPATLMLLSFLAAIVLGTGLLLLPPATVGGHIAPIDALFTATSAVCVTGLVVQDTGGFFTGFGQAVILVLIQLGGLGIMTVSVTFFQLLGRRVSFRQHMAMQDIFTHTPRRDIYLLLRSIFLFTLVAEAIGALVLFICWHLAYPWPQALWLAVFHSVSAFCNAGFALFADSLTGFRGMLPVNATVALLIVLGGIGFPVIYDFYDTRRQRRRGRQRHWSVQTRTVLLVSAILIVAGALLFWLLERNSTLRGLPAGEAIMAAVFQSITCRTAGFNTVDIGVLGEPTLALMMLLMFFGASPGSCGGGVKTTTLAVIVGFTWSRLRRRQRVNFFKRSLPEAAVGRSIALLMLSTALIAVVLVLLLLSMTHWLEDGSNLHGRFLPYLFETVSAFGTVGLSMGATAEFNTLSKLWLVATMFVGRVGVLTFAYVVGGPEQATGGYEYAEENIMIG